MYIFLNRKSSEYDLLDFVDLLHLLFECAFELI